MTSLKIWVLGQDEVISGAKWAQKFFPSKIQKLHPGLVQYSKKIFSRATAYKLVATRKPHRELPFSTIILLCAVPIRV